MHKTRYVYLHGSTFIIIGNFLYFLSNVFQTMDHRQQSEAMAIFNKKRIIMNVSKSMK